jgi:hypothetical protein
MLLMLLPMMHRPDDLLKGFLVERRRQLRYPRR